MSHSEADQYYSGIQHPSSFPGEKIDSLSGCMPCMRRCPQCGSNDLFQTVGGYLGSEWRCKRCGYQGALVVESKEEMPHPEAPGTGSSRMDVPLWIRVLAVIVLLIIVWISVPGW